jgi:ferritin-like metal-binding protein YciE
MTIHCALEAELRELYDTESRLVQGLTSLRGRTHSGELRNLLGDQREQTLEHIRRLERIFSDMKLPISRGPGEAASVIIQKAGSLLLETEPSGATDAHIVGAVLRAQSLLTAGYRHAAALAEALGMSRLHRSLQWSLEEESVLVDRLLALSRNEIIPPTVRHTVPAGV